MFYFSPFCCEVKQNNLHRHGDWYHMTSYGIMLLRFGRGWLRQAGQILCLNRSFLSPKSNFSSSTQLFKFCQSVIKNKGNRHCKHIVIRCANRRTLHRLSSICNRKTLQTDTYKPNVNFTLINSCLFASILISGKR